MSDYNAIILTTLRKKTMTTAYGMHSKSICGMSLRSCVTRTHLICMIFALNALIAEKLCWMLSCILFVQEALPRRRCRHKLIGEKRMKEFEIYFNDLTEEAQKELLMFMGISGSTEMNWDVFPITTITKEEDNDTEEMRQEHLGNNCQTEV